MGVKPSASMRNRNPFTLSGHRLRCRRTVPIGARGAARRNAPTRWRASGPAFCEVMKPMCKNALSELESSGVRNVVIKRAEWEAFEVVLAAEGRVNVRNVSKADPSVYSVTVENGVPESCTCPYDEYNDDPCKHRVHVALNDVLMDAVAASSGREVRADGGKPLAARERAAEAHADEVTAHTATDETGETYEFYRCEKCGLESTDETLAMAGCFRCSDE